MFEQREFYALEPGEPARLEINWGFLSRKIVIRLDDQDVARIPRSKLTQLHEVLLPDNSRLGIQLIASVKVLGMEFQPYLHLSRNGHVLPGVIPSPQERQQNANGWIIFIALMQFFYALFAPKILSLPSALTGVAFVVWQKSFSGAIATGLLLLGLLLVPKRHTRQKLIAALVIILGDLIMTLACIWVCRQTPSGYLASAEGLAALSLYQALKTSDRTSS